jgi:hypothetical protein
VATTDLHESEVLVGFHVVCLIDLLAQKERLKAWAAPISAPLSPEITIALKKTVGTVEWFRQAFSEFFAASAKSALPPTLIDTLPADKRDLFVRCGQSALEIQQFSDTFVFHSPLQNAHRDCTMMPFYQMLVACCWAVPLSLAGGVPLRGSICLGNGLKLRAGDFYGPALAEAHELESKHVGCPRVILSDEATKMLRGGAGFSDEPLIEAVMQTMRARCLRMVCEDTDGRVIVDYLGEEAHGLANKSSESMSLHLQAVEKAYRFVTSEQARFLCANNEILHKRYSLVRQYMDTRLPIWGLQHLATTG